LLNNEHEKKNSNDPPLRVQNKGTVPLSHPVEWMVSFAGEPKRVALDAEIGRQLALLLVLVQQLVRVHRRHRRLGNNSRTYKKANSVADPDPGPFLPLDPESVCLFDPWIRDG
jgi:hypothetical protein